VTAARGRRALVVDDAADLRLVMRLALEGAGWEVAEAADGAEAVDLLETGALPPDLMLLDLRMPVLDGRGVLDWMDAHGWTPRVQVIVLSAWADRETAAEITARGHRWLGKPFDMVELLTLAGTGGAAVPT
jgi:CheY-like chemotaxis protein